MHLPSTIDGDKYERKLVSDLVRGDVVPVESVAHCRLIEHTVCDVSRETIGGRVCVAVRFDTGSVDFLTPNQRVYYTSER